MPGPCLLLLALGGGSIFGPWDSGAAGSADAGLLLLGGSWDLATTYNWGHNPTHNRSNPYKPI